MSALDIPLHILLAQPLKEVVLSCWQQDTGVGTIMSLCQITEDELEDILPRRFWKGIRHDKCPRCSGTGSLTKVVPWEEDDLYRPKIEAAKLLDWREVADWRCDQ
jgi:hypothetical protein